MLPKRAIVALAATALALILLFSFKTPDDTGLAASGFTRHGIGAVATPAPTQPVGGGLRTPRPTTNPGATAAPKSGSLSDGTVSGPVIDTRFGPVQVQVTVSGGRLTEVTALQLPTDHPRSLAISEYAEPILRSEALQARSAQIDLVSGATYTSIAYTRSLQAALDQAGG